MNKFFCAVALTCVIATNAYAGPKQDAEEVYDGALELLSKSEKIISAYEQKNIPECKLLEKEYAPKVKELYDKGAILNSEYIDISLAMNDMRSCFSCFSPRQSCNDTIALLKKAGDKMKTKK